MSGAIELPVPPAELSGHNTGHWRHKSPLIAKHREWAAMATLAADISSAKAAAEKNGLRLLALEKRPDGTVKLEFGDFEPVNDDWRAGSPLYGRQ